MKTQSGFVEWLLIAKLIFTIVVVAGGTLLGVQLYPTPPGPIPEPDLLHVGVIQTVEPCPEIGTACRAVYFQDGAFYRFNRGCPPAAPGAVVRVLRTAEPEIAVPIAELFD